VKKPAVSLLIPCYNNARFLPALFDSIRAQATPFAEILLWDDGSTDESAAVAKSLGAKVIKAEQNLGPAGARNALARRAAHEWIHFHDADDLMGSAYNQQMFGLLGDRVDVVFCDADWINENNDPIIRWRYSQSAMTPDPVGYFLTHPLGINNCIYRREAFTRAGGFDSELVPWEDADFHVRLALTGSRFQHVDQVLTRSNRHDGGISVDLHRNWRARLKALQGYAASWGSRYHPLIAAEAELAARELACIYDDQAQKAVELCRECGGNPPSGTGLKTSIARALLPTVFLLRLQTRRRRSARRA
jgi:glycosyltransferase involved in cell wall biosynthesis